MENLLQFISVFDLAFVAAIIGTVEMLKFTFPKINDSSSLKRGVTVAVSLVAGLTIYLGMDISVMESFFKSIVLLIEAAGVYVLAIKPMRIKDTE